MPTGIIYWADTRYTLSLGEGVNDELHFLRPREVVAADYIPLVDLSVGYGKVLERL